MRTSPNPFRIITNLPIDTYALPSHLSWTFLRPPPALHGHPGLLTAPSVPASRLQRRSYSYHDGHRGRGLVLYQASLASSAPATRRCPSVPRAKSCFSFSSSCCSRSTQPLPRLLPSELLYRPRALLRRSRPLSFLFFQPLSHAAQGMKSALRSGSTRRDFGLANPSGCCSSWHFHLGLRLWRQRRQKQRQQQLPYLPGGSYRGRIFAKSQRRTGRIRGARRGRATAP